MIETIRTSEVRWTLKDCNSIVRAVVTKSAISDFDTIPGALLREDFDGFLEFILAVKQAMEETKPQVAS